MTEKPILFSGPMVRALLDGRKTQTRRVVKWPLMSASDGRRCRVFGTDDVEEINRLMAIRQHAPLLHVSQPYGRPGDRLWVRETHAQVFEVDIPAGRPRGSIGTAGSPARPEWRSRYVYAADGPMPNVQWHHVGDSQPVRWNPSIHMPRAASRILLEVTSVRVERLQDMEGQTAFESDALKEGINRIHHGDGEYMYHAFRNEPHPNNWVDPCDAFRELWGSLNAARGHGWDVNPWVWVVEFRRVTS